MSIGYAQGVQGSDQNALRTGIKMLSYVLAVPCMGFVGYVAGAWLDERLGTGFLVTILAVVGFGGAIFKLYQEIRAYQKTL